MGTGHRNYLILTLAGYWRADPRVGRVLGCVYYAIICSVYMKRTQHYTGRRILSSCICDEERCLLVDIEVSDRYGRQNNK